MNRFYAKRSAPTESGCIEWLGCRINGYGRFGFRGANQLAHRVAWILEVGEIPSGMHVLHKCDNPACSNVEHLYLGTDEDNSRDRESRARGNHARGKRVNTCKLTESDVLTIRALFHWSGFSKAEIAREYGVSDVNITAIVRRDTWKHVEGVVSH